PDAYFACDQSFMDQVSDLFLDTVEISTNQLVILVRRGNPHGIHSLNDLGKPGLKVGVGHEKQCALGVLTQRTLQQRGVQQTVMSNVVTQVPTGDMLVNELRAGALDAVVAYVSNAATAGAEVESVPLDLDQHLAAASTAGLLASPAGDASLLAADALFPGRTVTVPCAIA